MRDSSRVAQQLGRTAAAETGAGLLQRCLEYGNCEQLQYLPRDCRRSDVTRIDRLLQLRSRDVAEKQSIVSVVHWIR